MCTCVYYCGRVWLFGSMSVTIETIYVVMTTRQLVLPKASKTNFPNLKTNYFPFFLFSPCLLPWGRLPNHPQEVLTWQLYMHKHTHSNRSQMSRMSIHVREGEKSFVCIQESPRRTRLDHTYFRANRMD